MSSALPLTCHFFKNSLLFKTALDARPTK
uniref:Uncharacterized protein n=1 Tax=Rhizophora mucronata TaxID=61149 RepID=A0A2P2N5R2_RHIMU